MSNVWADMDLSTTNVWEVENRMSVGATHSRGIIQSAPSPLSTTGVSRCSIGCRYGMGTLLLAVGILWAILMLPIERSSTPASLLFSDDSMLQRQHRVPPIQHQQDGIMGGGSPTVVSSSTAAREAIVSDIERCQGRSVLPLDVYYGNTTSPTATARNVISKINNRVSSLELSRQSVHDFKSAVSCQEVLGLPPGPDGRGLFNLALAPSQVPAHSLLLSTDAFNTLIFDEAVSVPGNRSLKDYRVVSQDTDVGANDGVSKDEFADNYRKMKPHGHRFMGRYGFAHSPFSSGTTAGARLEVYAGLGRWSTWRGSQRDVDGGDGTFSITYLAYVSLTWPNMGGASITSSPSPVVRWHPLGALPPMSPPMRAALLRFRNARFRSPNKRFRKGGMHREGLEDCIFMPPFHMGNHTNTNSRHTRRRFVICNVGFTFVDGHIFIGEVTSRFEKQSAAGSASSSKGGGSPMLFDNEWIPIIDDPVPFGVDLSSPSKNNPISMNKNWNAVPCDTTSSSTVGDTSGVDSGKSRSAGGEYGMGSGEAAPVQTQGVGDWIVCLQTSVAPVVKTVAYNMATRKVVASWESVNGITAPGRLRNGKGVIPLLSHELPPLLHPPSAAALAGKPSAHAIGSAYPKYLALYHEVMRGHYRSVWGLVDSLAPYALLVKTSAAAYPATSAADEPRPSGGAAPSSSSSSSSPSPFRVFKFTSSKVEYVRSITISQDRAHIYLTFSEDDGRGKVCVVPLWRATQAAVGNLE